MRTTSLILLFLTISLLTSCQLAGDSLEQLQNDSSNQHPGFIAVLLALGTLASEDLSCITGGLLVSKGAISYFLATLGCGLGIFIGDLILFGLGAVFGKRLTQRRPLNWWISEKRLERGARLFKRHGGAFIMTSRFLPGARVPAYIAAGLLGYPFHRFAFYLLIACALWTPLLVGFARLFGGRILEFLSVYERYTGVGMLLTILLLWFFWSLVIPLFSYKGRRLLFSRWIRIRRWEFWPLAVFYPPVVGYILWLGWKHRCLTLFTITNPSIPASGFAMESKADILDGLLAGQKDRQEIASFRRLRQEISLTDRLCQLDDFMGTEPFPVVLKPDIGERGQGVAIIRSKAEAHAFLDRCDEDVIAQEYIGGVEYGVFYYRRPNEFGGHILSITHKRLPTITADGRSTLEELILRDERAVTMARFFLNRFAERLEDIPPRGEVIKLTELGTHCRGSIFENANHLKSEALARAMDRISRPFEGFYFGRYDLRVPSPEHLQQGKGIKILELNGVSSESGHIYHPGNRLWKGYRDLMYQWRIAFEIGAVNRAEGHRPLELAELRDLIRQHGNRNSFEA